MDAVSLTSLTLEATPITKEQIQAGWLEYQRRVRDGEATVEGINFDDVVIAQHVTREQLDQVNEWWLEDVRPALRPDGTLVITKASSRQHGFVCEAIQADFYDSVRDLKPRRFLRRRRLVCRDGGEITPDIELYYPSERGTKYPTDVPFVLVEMEFANRTVHHVIRTAASYLNQLPTVERVTILKFFPPISQIWTTTSSSAYRHWRSASMRSFGNAEIRDFATDAFVHPDADSPLEPFAEAGHHRDAAQWLPYHYDAACLNDDDLLDQDHVENFDFGMPAPMPTVEIDLVHAFEMAVCQWDEREK